MIARLSVYMCVSILKCRLYRIMGEEPKFVRILLVGPL